MLQKQGPLEAAYIILAKRRPPFGSHAKRISSLITCVSKAYPMALSIIHWSKLNPKVYSKHSKAFLFFKTREMIIRMIIDQEQAFLIGI